MGINAEYMGMPTTLEHYIHRVGRTARAGRAGRSVSIAGEGERKIVKEIVKRARDPVKSRVVPTDVVAKYKTKVGEVEKDVNRVVEEEKAEKEIAKLENRANRLQNNLTGEGGDDRTWFQTKKQREQEKLELRQQKKDPTFTKTKKKKAEARKPPQNDAEAK